MNKIIACFVLSLICVTELRAQQVADDQFQYAIADPQYRIGDGPLLLFDEAHNNAVTLKGTYAAFSNLLLADGYRLRNSKEKISFDAAYF